MANFDSYFDPPEPPDYEESACPVDSCEGWGEVLTEDGLKVHFACVDCGEKWSADIPQDPWDGYDAEAERRMEEQFARDMEDYTECEDVVEHCNHGKPHHECDACDFLSDIAYDAAREKR